MVLPLVIHRPSSPLCCCHVSNKPLTSPIAQRHGVAAGSDTSACPSPTSRHVGMARRATALSGPAMISVTPPTWHRLRRRVWDDRQDVPSTRRVQSTALDQLLLFVLRAFRHPPSGVTCRESLGAMENVSQHSPPFPSCSHGWLCQRRFLALDFRLHLCAPVHPYE
jgi:hypothetical protein